MRKIEGQSTTVTDNIAERTVIFPPDQKMLAYIVGFFYFYAELLCLELEMILHPDEYKLSKFVL